MHSTLLTIFQLILALGLINVWLIRCKKPTSYRAGDAQDIVEEFAEYGLPKWVCYLVGFLKVSSAVALLLGFFMPRLILPAASLIAFLMIGAVAMHFKVKDPIKKTVPALLMLAMSSYLIVSYL